MRRDRQERMTARVERGVEREIRVEVRPGDVVEVELRFCLEPDAPGCTCFEPGDRTPTERKRAREVLCLQGAGIRGIPRQTSADRHGR